MSRKSRIADLRKAKDRRAKKLAAAGVVLLAVVLAFEVPKVLKSSHTTTPPAATTTTTTTAPGVSTPPQTTAPGTTAVAAASPTTNTPLPDSDQAPRHLKSELYSFSSFGGKDPFVPQVVDTTQGLPDPASGSSGSSSQTVPTLTASVTSSSGSGDATTAATTSGSSVRTLAASGTVKMQINGRVETVRVGASFPSSNPLFKLVSVTGGVVRIGIAKGGYASGAQTVSLGAGKSLTLVDTADGTHYKIQLLSTS
jgi:hypothetical protein